MCSFYGPSVCIGMCASHVFIMTDTAHRKDGIGQYAYDMKGYGGTDVTKHQAKKLHPCVPLYHNIHCAV
jgi:hypothetical protein